MATVFSVTVKDEAVLAALERLRANMSAPSMRIFFSGLGGELKKKIRSNFENMQSPDGVAWKDLSLATKIQRLPKSKNFKRGKSKTVANLSKSGRAALGGRMEILRDKGHLYDSIQIQSVTPSSVTVGTNRGYAAIHQFGGMAGRGRKVRIPARPFIGIDERGSAQIVDTLRQYVLQDV